MTIEEKEWIKIEDGKPEMDMMCYVTNTKAGVLCWLAQYEKHFDIFRIYDPGSYNHPPIDVTHWIGLPWAPLE